MHSINGAQSYNISSAHDTKKDGATLADMLKNHVKGPIIGMMLNKIKGDQAADTKANKSPVPLPPEVQALMTLQAGIHSAGSLK